MARAWAVSVVALGVGCAWGGDPEAPGGYVVAAEILEQVPVAPGPDMPEDAALQNANNNLDVEDHDGRRYLAVRTAPNHFASALAEMVVLSRPLDGAAWRVDGRFALGRDVREPQLVSTPDGLILYFAVLGTNPLDFEPGGARVTRYLGEGAWTELEEAFPEDFIPWRIKPHPDGGWHVFGYTGGGNVYDFSEEPPPIEVRWLRSDDALSWEPAVGDEGVVHVGGCSETDAVRLDDGRWLAVLRNEAGDADGFGSKVCVAPAEDPGAWTCTPDPRKYDSPLMLQAAGEAFLIARRQVTETGAYDLGVEDPTWNERPQRERYLGFQAAYWGTPKRCAIWRVTADPPAVTWLADLPSRGDTCFPEALPTAEAGVWEVYNYSSDPDGEERSWLQGQNGPTGVYRATVRFSAGVQAFGDAP